MPFTIKEKDDETTDHIKGARIAAMSQALLDARQHYRDCLTFQEITRRNNFVGSMTAAQRAVDHALDMWLDIREKAEGMGIDPDDLKL